MENNSQFKIVKAGESVPVFVGGRAVVDNCINALRNSFFFVAGSAKPIVDEFPYSVQPA